MTFGQRLRWLLHGKYDEPKSASVELSIRVGPQRLDYTPPTSAAEAAKRKIDQAREVFGPNAMVQVIANNMLAGPCPACTELARKPVPLARAPLGPLPECPHPDQCTLLFRSVMPDDF